MNDALGQRIKEQYEDRTRFMLPRRSYTIIRIDGKAFHTFTRGMNKPFDHKLMNAMQNTTITLCESIQGAAMGYTQSDEISLVLTDFATPQTEAWFNGNVQKMASVAASIATAAFNYYFGTIANDPKKLAMFDARVFTVPDRTEVKNYLIWRQQDAVRNSVQSAAQSCYSQKELHGKNGSQLQEMLFQAGINWNYYSASEKRGTAVIKYQYVKAANLAENGFDTIRTGWKVDDTPSFTQEPQYLENLIPKIGDSK